MNTVTSSVRDRDDSRHSKIAFLSTLGISSFVILVMTGCGGGDEEQIVAYAVPKPHVIYEQNHAPPPDRTLGAIILGQQTGWFFKLSGTNERVNEEAEPFNTLIASVRLAEDPNGPPTFTVPAGWDRQEGSGIRHATLVISKDEPKLEVTVTPLPITAQDRDRYRLDNVNRWRNELGLAPISIAQLADHTSVIDLDGTSALVVNAAGHRGAGGMPGNLRAPFASSSSPDRPQAVQRETQLVYDVPAGWSPGELAVSRGGITVRFKAAFEVVAEPARLDVTISTFPAAVARPLLNINRWRQQLGLPNIDETELNEAFVATSVGGKPAQQIELHSDADADHPETILGVLAEHAGEAYFIKLKGDQSLAQRERAHFEQFVQSIQFSSVAAR